MKVSDLGRHAFCTSVVAAMLAGCGGSQPPIGAVGAMPQSRPIALARTMAHHGYRVLYSFKSRGKDGNSPYAGLIDVSGTLYGTTIGEGANGAGTVFSISTSGSERVLYSFGNGAYDGRTPYAGLTDVHGTLFGTTLGGGTGGK